MLALLHWRVGSIPSPWIWQTYVIATTNWIQWKWRWVTSKAKVIKGIGASTLASWINTLQKSEGHSRSSIGRSMQRGTEAASLRPAPPCQLHEWVTLGMDPLVPVESSDDSSPRQHLTVTSWETPSENRPAQSCSKFWSTENLREIIIGFFLSLCFGVIYYTAI